MELHHATCSEETGRRVWCGQEGRIAAGLSAGDFPYGYESFPTDPEYEQRYSGRGPTPTRGIRICRDQAKWVLWIFKQFASGRSIDDIARELSRRKVARDRRARATQWFASTIRKMLGNAKYSGLWTWGRTAWVRDSAGRKKQVSAPEAEILVVERPDLRIVMADLWDRIQRRFQLLKAKTGKKPGQLSRAPQTHYSETNPMSVAQAIYVCGRYGGKMQHQGSREHVYRSCINYIDGRDQCPGRPRLPAGEARTILLDFVSQLLNSMPDWVAAAIEKMTSATRLIQLLLAKWRNDDQQI